jgi:UDP-2,3-diacylglucosamine pyrophosphatase LpxH
MASYRTIFISDLHVGTQESQVAHLHNWLKSQEFDRIIMVGDILDLWAWSRKFYLPKAQSDFIKYIISISKKVTFIPGNHDETFRTIAPCNIVGIQIENEIVYELQDGRKMLVIHGDQFDQVVLYARWLAVLGDLGYQFLLKSNHWINKIRTKFSLPRFSLAAYVKSRVKRAVNFIDGFENSVILAVKERGLDGIICGHIHSAAIREIDGMLYCNPGEGVDLCTAIVEHRNGELEIITWI